MGKHIVHFLVFAILLFALGPMGIDAAFDPNFGTGWELARGLLPFAISLLASLYLRGHWHGVVDVVIAHAVALIGSAALLVQYLGQWLAYYRFSIFLAPDFHGVLVLGAFLSSVTATYNLVFLLSARARDWRDRRFIVPPMLDPSGVHGRQRFATKGDIKIACSKEVGSLSRESGLVIGYLWEYPSVPQFLRVWWYFAHIILVGAFGWNVGHVVEWAMKYFHQMIGPVLMEAVPIYAPASAGMSTVVAPTGKGKGTTWVITQCFNRHSHSRGQVRALVLLDPKGQNTGLTWKFRESLDDPRSPTKMRVFIAFDPQRRLETGGFLPGPAGEKWKYHATRECFINPLDIIPADDAGYAEFIRMMAEAFFKDAASDGNSTGQYFADKATTTTSGCIGIVTDLVDLDALAQFGLTDADRTFGTVIDIINLPIDKLKELLTAVSENRLGPSLHGFSKLGLGLPHLAANQILNAGENELGSDIGTLTNGFSKWFDPKMRRLMSKSGISWGRLNEDGKFEEERFEPIDYNRFYEGWMDVSFIVKDDQLKAKGPWLRMMLKIFLANVKDHSEALERHFLFLLDELAQTGGLPELPELAAIARGKGIHISSILQDKSQGDLQYKEAFKTILANSSMKIFLGSGESDTAELVTKLFGKMTARLPTYSMSGASGRFDGGSGSAGYQVVGMDVINPNEVSGLPKTDGLAVITGEQYGIRYIKIPYYFWREARDKTGEPLFPVPDPYDASQVAGYEQKHGISLRPKPTT